MKIQSVVYPYDEIISLLKREIQKEHRQIIKNIHILDDDLRDILDSFGVQGVEVTFDVESHNN